MLYEEINIPDIIDIDIKHIKLDEKNPNKMTNEQLEVLKRNIQKYGFLVPIILNKDYIIIDGEHRYMAAEELGLTKVKGIILDVNDIDKSVIRQVMNKLKGTHDYNLDQDEIKFLLDELGKDGLMDITGLPETQIDSLLEGTNFEEIPNVCMKGEMTELNDVIIISLETEEQRQYIKDFFDLEQSRKSIKGDIAMSIIKSKVKEVGELVEDLHTDEE